MDKEYRCPACDCIIPEERVNILRELKYSDNDIFCVTHAMNRPVKAIYSGEHGTSDLILCDRVYSDSVRKKFYDAEVDKDEDVSDDSEEEQDHSTEDY